MWSLKWSLLTGVVALALAGGSQASNPPVPSSYTDAQLKSLASTPGGSNVSSPTVQDVPEPDYWGCWSNTYQRYHGTWPQQQIVYLHTSWCGSGPGGVIRTRTSYTTHGSTFCSGSGDYAVKVSGGVGFDRVVVEGGAYFSCPTGIPWIETHWHVWLKVVYYPAGGSAVIGGGP